jgi:hypothetical protein
LIVLYKSNRSPSVSDSIKVAGVAVDLTGATVRFRMRAENSATLAVDAVATIVGAPAGGNVRYDWAIADVAAAGDFVAWWSVTLASGLVQDTSEFQVKISTTPQAPQTSVRSPTSARRSSCQRPRRAATRSSSPSSRPRRLRS